MKNKKISVLIISLVILSFLAIFLKLTYREGILAKQSIKCLGNNDKIHGESFIKRCCQSSTYLIQLHRGGGIGLPKNTLETFKWAWSQHVIPEADIQMISDDEIVCFHDTNLKRICPGIPAEIQEKEIRQMTLAQIKMFDVGKFRGKPGQKIPILNEVFKAMSGFPERFLFLDYKYVDMEKLTEMVKKHDVEQQVIFTSKSHDLIMQWKRLIPQSQTLLWIGGTEKNIAKELKSLQTKGYNGITILQFHYKLNDSKCFLSDKFLLKSKDELEKQSIIFQLLPWEINDKSVYEKLINMGIKSFATDYPEAILPVYMSLLHK